MPRSNSKKKEFLGKKTLHVCEICDKQFSTPSLLIAHTRCHTGEKPFHCSLCGKSFSERSNLRVHEKRHGDVKPFQCQWCQKSFVSQPELTTHKVTHTGKKSFQCTQCDKSFATKGNLYVHNLTHTRIKRYKCSQCGAEFLRNHHLRRHYNSHFAFKCYKCDICEKQFTRNTTLANHIKNKHTEIKSFQCLKCGTCVGTSSDLIRHENNCPEICMEKSKRNSKLKSTRCQCGICGILCKNLKSLEYHEQNGCKLIKQITEPNNTSMLEVNKEMIATVSTETGECLFLNEADQTELGGKQIVIDMNEHIINIDTLEEEGVEQEHFEHEMEGIMVDIDGHIVNIIVMDEVEGSDSNVNLEQNKKQKCGTLICQHCGKTFSAPSKLEIHSRIHTGFKPFRCEQCGKLFNQKIHLINHQIKVHNIIPEVRHPKHNGIKHEK